MKRLARGAGVLAWVVRGATSVVLILAFFDMGMAMLFTHGIIAEYRERGVTVAEVEIELVEAIREPYYDVWTWIQIAIVLCLIELFLALFVAVAARRAQLTAATALQSPDPPASA